MKKIISLLLAMTLSLTVGTTAGAVANEKLIIGFGDSNTANSNWEEFQYDDQKKWMNMIGKERTVKNMGIGGNTTGMMMKRIHTVIAEKPDTVILMAGTNDAVLDKNSIPKTSWKKFESNLNTMINRLEKEGIHVVLMTTLPIIETEYYKRHDKKLYAKYGGARAFHNSYNDITRRVAAKKSVPLMDTYFQMTRFAGGADDRRLYRSNLIDPSGTHMQPYGARILYLNLKILLEKNGL